MFSRSFAMFPRLCAVAALVMLGTTAAAQVTLAAPSSAAVSAVALLAWGDNSLGQLGDGVSGGSSNTPVLVSLPPGVTPVAIAGSGGGGDPQPSQWAAYAIGSDGKLYAWGDNSSGELGNGSTTGSDTPVMVSLPTGVTPTAVSAAQGSAYAIGSDGHLYAWGTNVYGNLGNGSTTGSDTPVLVSLPAGVTPKAISGGYESAYAIGSDGKLYAWGDDFYGELGDGNTATVSDTPVVVSLPAGVTPESIAGGGGAGYAIGSSGNLYSWGLNSDDQLGDGSTTDSATPVLVALPSGVTAKSVTGGGGFAHAIGSDGKLYGWGLDGTAGQLGDGGGNSAAATPIVISLAAGVTPKAVSDNLHTGYAIGSDGNIYAWGYGLAGELGDGAPGNFSPPVVVSLPPGSTPESLGQEPGSVGGYAIVNVTLTAPTVTAEPTGLTVHAGQDASFTAAADGFPAPTVQWQVSTNGGTTFTPISGATSDTLNLPARTLAENGNQYEAVFTNGTAPDATTNAAVLTVIPDVAPTITLEPLSQTVFEGDPATFTAAADGFPAPTVQWQVSTNGGTTFSPISGATSDTLNLPATTLAENGNQYEAVFTNGTAPDATTNPVVLSVSPAIAPVITTNPISQTVNEGDSVTFTAAASGTPTPTVEWQVSIDGGSTWIDIPALNSPTISGIPPAYLNFMNGWQFRAVFTNAGGSAMSNAATLTVLPPVAPVVTTQPSDQSVSEDESVTFTAAASGTPTPTVEWQVSIDGGSTWIDIPALNSPTISGIPPAYLNFMNGWQFRAVFTNAGGSATTTAATLTES